MPRIGVKVDIRVKGWIRVKIRIGIRVSIKGDPNPNPNLETWPILFHMSNL
jgi:hypothetical protein